MDRLLDVHGVGDVDYRAAVVQEAGAVQDGDAQLVVRHHAGHERHALIGVPDGHDLRLGRVVPYPVRFLLRTLQSELLHHAAEGEVRQRALARTGVANHDADALALRLLGLHRPHVDAPCQNVELLLGAQWRARVCKDHIHDVRDFRGQASELGLLLDLLSVELH
eukprot:6182-Pyramimonas_sp.AAC.1